MPSLVFLAGPIAGRRYKLGEGEYVIGRRSDCQIFVPDMRVSRQHARLIRNGEGWTLEDLGSNNGTYINGVRLQSATVLRHEDEIMIANNKIRVEAQDFPSEQRVNTEGGSAVTIVDVSASSLIRSRDDSGSSRLPVISSGLISVTDQRAVRLIERKLEALTQVLQVTAASDTAEALLEKLVDALLDLFPQAEDVGVLVQDERTQELRVAVQRHRRRAPAITGETDPVPRTITEDRRPFGGELRVPGTIIQHVVSDRRGVLLGESADADDEAVGTRMGAPLIYHGAHYGVVYVESHQQGFRQEDVDLLQTIANHAGMAIHSTRMATQLARREQLERDLRVARQIQRSLLPATLPQVVGLDFAVHYEPAYQIGGDFYDFIWHDQSHLAIMITSYAGMAACAVLVFLGVAVRSALRAQRPTWTADVAMLGFVVIALTIASWAVSGLAVWHAVDQGQDASVRTLNFVDTSNFLPLMMGMICAYVGTGAAGLASGTLPRWLAVASIVIGLLAPLGPLGFVPAMLLPIWLIVVSALVRVGEPESDPS